MVRLDVEATSSSDRLGIFLEWNEGTGPGGMQILLSMTVRDLERQQDHGLRIGDVITAIQGETVAGMTQSVIEATFSEQ